jgi:hypothetical protein
MTKKIVLTLLAALLAMGTISAQSGKSAKEVRQQNFVFGPRVGLSTPYQNVVTNTTALSDMIGGANLGVQLGGYIRGMLPLKKSKFLLYGQLDASWAMDFYFGGGGNASAGYFNFPVVLGGGYWLRSDLMLRAGWGPNYSINVYSCANTLFGKSDKGYQTEVGSMLERDPWGWVAEVGADYKNWTLDLRYVNQFRSREYPHIADETRYISWGLTLGYRF